MSRCTRPMLLAVAALCAVAACRLFVDTSGLGDGERPADGGGDDAAPEAQAEDAGLDTAAPDAEPDASIADADAEAGKPPIARYLFDEGSGTVVKDKVAPPLDLQMVWFDGGDDAGYVWANDGLVINGDGMAVRSTGAALKLTNAVLATGELTVETWAQPANTTQSGPARVVSLAPDTTAPTFTIGQSGQQWVFRSMLNGGFHELFGGLVLIANTHVVGVRGKNGARTLYVNGTVAATDIDGGALETASTSSPLSLANEALGGRQWHGKLLSVAIFDRALPAAAVSARFNAGAK